MSRIFTRFAASLHFLVHSCSQQDPADELGMLCLFLGLGREGQPPQLAAAGVSWVTESPQVLLRSWCREFNQFAGGVPVAARVSGKNIFWQLTMLNIKFNASITLKLQRGLKEQMSNLARVIIL